MAETTQNGCNFKEACCIDAGRIYDSCCDRDCLEDLRCYFTETVQTTVNDAISVKMRSAEVVSAYIEVEPVNFNRGFYSCDITFFFIVTLDVYSAPHTCPTTVKGAACFTKKVILFGSDGNVKIFTNSPIAGENCTNITELTSNMPKCVVQSVDPVPLGAKLGEVKSTYENNCVFPDVISELLGGTVVTDLDVGTPTVYVTLGLFTVVQLIRQVQMLIPVYDFCIPEKQCNDSTDQPCDIFKRISFPTDDFFPPRPDCFENNGCGCTTKNEQN